jgi:hypothetical protein
MKSETKYALLGDYVYSRSLTLKLIPVTGRSPHGELTRWQDL